MSSHPAQVDNPVSPIPFARSPQLARLLLAAAVLSAAGCGGGATDAPAENPFGTGSGESSSASRRPPAAPVHVPSAPSSRRENRGLTPGAAAGSETSSPSTAERSPAGPTGSSVTRTSPGSTPAETANTPGASPPAPAPGSHSRTPPGGALPAAVADAVWPQFRGPGGSGLSSSTTAPVRWSDEDNLRWKFPLPGPGASSPVVRKGRVYVTSYTGFGTASSEGSKERLERQVVCLDLASGTLLWQYKAPVATAVPDWASFIPRHGYASASLALANDTIYAFFDTAGAVAINDQGAQQWAQSDLGTGTHEWGSASSPVVHEDMLLVTAGVESGSVVALNRSNGNILWRYTHVDECWGTPVVVDSPAGEQEIVLSMKGRIVGLEPLTGKELWTCRGIDDYICPSVVAGKGVVFAIGGRRGRAIAVRTGGRGNVTDTHVVWTADVGSNVPTPLLLGERLMWVDDAGTGHCLDAATGERLARRRTDSGNVYASPVAAGGRLYVVSRDKGTLVLTADEELRELARNVFESDSSVFNATPAIVGGLIILRSNQAVYCIGGGESVATPPAAGSL